MDVLWAAHWILLGLNPGWCGPIAEIHVVALALEARVRPKCTSQRVNQEPKRRSEPTSDSQGTPLKRATKCRVR